MRWMFAVAAGMVVGISVFATGSANAQPLPAPPPGPAQPGSTTEELADMVMDVIESGEVVAPAPPR